MLSAEERYRLLEEASELSERWEYEQMLTLLSEVEDHALLAEPELAYLAALAHYRVGRRDRSSQLLEKIRLSSAPHGKDRLYCRRVSLRGALYVEQGRLDEARQCFAEVMFIASVRDYVPQVTTAIMNLGVIESIKCNWDEALAAFERAIAAYENLGELYNLGGAHHNLAMTFRELGCLDHAATHCEKASRIFQDSHAPIELVYTNYERALLLLAAGDLTFAESTARRAMSLLDNRAGQEEGEGLKVLGMVLKARGHLEEAEVCLAGAASVATTERSTLLRAQCDEELADLYARLNRTEEAQLNLLGATELYVQMGAEKRARRALNRLSSMHRAD